MRERLSEHLSKALIIARRELAGYFGTPVAYVFMVIFVALTGAFAFFVGGFFERGQADLQTFFNYHPWLYLLLVPAVAMRLWAEERKTGTIELLMTLPVTTAEAVVGKFLAAWAFVGVALLLTIPMWVTVNILGRPDNGVIFSSYLGSFLTAGAFLAIGSCISALTKNQVIAFIVAATICFLFLMSGLEFVLTAFRGWAPELLVDAISSLSFLNHFTQLTRGIIGLSSLLFYLSMITFWLFANVIVVEQKKAA
jgi:ABC-2 type transport system permease protein